jgi:hypothetical protein
VNLPLVLPRCPFPTCGRTVPWKGTWPESQIFPELAGLARLADWVAWLWRAGSQVRQSSWDLRRRRVSCGDGEMARLHTTGDDLWVATLTAEWHINSLAWFHVVERQPISRPYLWLVLGVVVAGGWLIEKSLTRAGKGAP